MKTLFNFLGFGKTEETKKAHTYRKATTENGSYYKRDDGLNFFIASDLLN